MRQIKLWLAVAILALTSIGNVFGQTKGDKVVVVEQTDLKSGTTVLKTVARGNYLTVRDVYGNWLRVDFDGDRGWLDRNHVILASQAIRHFTDELRRNSQDSTALVARAIAWEDKGELTIAMRDCTEALAINPREFWAYNVRGGIWQDKKEYDRAIADYDEGIRLDPTYEDIYFSRGHCHHEKKNYTKAIDDYTQAIRLNPKEWKSYLCRGSSFGDNHQFDKAYADYTVALELDSESVWTNNGMAWFLATCPSVAHRNGVRAVELATKAVDLAKAMGESAFGQLDTLAAAHAETGNFEQAVKLQQQALALAPSKDKSEFELRLKLYQSGQPYRDQPETEATATTAAK